MNKRLLSLCLAGLLLLPTFASCSDGGNDPETSGNDPEINVESVGDPSEGDPSAEGEEETAVSDDLPEMSFDGHDYMIYNANAESNEWYTTTFVTCEEDSAEPILSAIFNRNLAVEERFDVTISESYQDASQIQQSITAGLGDFDIALVKGGDALNLARAGYLRDLNKLDYLNFEKPYWDAKAAEQLTISGKLYMGVGDFLTTHIDETIVMYFNKELVERHSLENLYDLVNAYEWTYDKMGELGSIVCGDANGDGKYDDNDDYGLMSWSGVLYPFLLFGSGEMYVTKTEEDVPDVTFYNDRFVSVYEKLLTICHSNGDTFTYDAQLKSNTKGLSNNHRVQEIMFPNNQVLFWVECASWARSLRDMDADFGIIPAPMYDTEQGEYYTYVNGNFFAPVVPTSVTGEDLDRTCIVLEALNSMSTDTVRKAYYDISLKYKSSRDKESQAMLDLLFSTRLYDSSVVYGFADISSTIYAKAADNNTDIASFYNKNRKSMNKQIKKIVEDLAEYDY